MRKTLGLIGAAAYILPVMTHPITESVLNHTSAAERAAVVFANRPVILHNDMGLNLAPLSNSAKPRDESGEVRLSEKRIDIDDTASKADKGGLQDRAFQMYTGRPVVDGADNERFNLRLLSITSATPRTAPNASPSAVRSADAWPPVKKHVAPTPVFEHRQNVAEAPQMTPAPEVSGNALHNQINFVPLQ